MTEPRRLRIDSPAALAGVIPHLAKYQPGSDHVAILSSAPVVGTQASVLEWPDAPGAWREGVDEVERVRSGTTQWVVAGYGPEGAARAELVASRLLERIGERATVAAVLQVHDGMVHDYAYGVWTPAGPMRDMREHFVMQGSDPAASREAHVARFQPYAEPTWQPLSMPQVAQLEAVPPSERASRAREILDALAVPGHDRPTADGAWLAEAAGSHMSVRDAVMQHGYDKERAGALVELFRGSPQVHRSSTALLAAAGMYASGDTIAAGAILPHVHPDTPHASMAKLMQQSIRMGLSPEILTHVKRDELDANLAADDRTWQARRGSTAAHRFLAQQAPAVQATSTPTTSQPYRPRGTSPEPPSLER